MDKETPFDTRWLNNTEMIVLAEWANRHNYLADDFDINNKKAVQELANLLQENGESPRNVLNEYWDKRANGINPIAKYKF
jgi:hypothetical protein